MVYFRKVPSKKAKSGYTWSFTIENGPANVNKQQEEALLQKKKLRMQQKNYPPN